MANRYQVEFVLELYIPWLKSFKSHANGELENLRSYRRKSNVDAIESL